MNSGDEFAQLGDPAFLTGRQRVRDELRELTERYRKLNEEFDRGRGRHGHLHILDDRLRSGDAQGAAEEVELEQEHVLRHRFL